MSLQLVPKSGFLLIKPIEPKPVGAGLVQLADYWDEPETSGEVVALADSRCPHCGEGKPPEVAVGDVVVFPPSCGNDCEFEGTRYLLIRDTDVLAVVDEGSDAVVVGDEPTVRRRYRNEKHETATVWRW